MARCVDAEQLLQEHVWIQRIGFAQLEQQKVSETRVKDAQIEAAAARHQADTEELEAKAAETMASEAFFAGTATAAKRERGEAELAEAKSRVMQATLQLELEGAAARLQGGKARAARAEEINANSRLQDSDPQSTSAERALVELTKAKAVVVQETHSADAAATRAALARSELTAVQAAARALGESREMQESRDLVSEAESALELAKRQADSTAVSSAHANLNVALTEANREEREAVIANAVAAVARAQVEADRAAMFAREEEEEAQAASELVKARQAVLANAQMEGEAGHFFSNATGITEASKALTHAHEEHEREVSEAENAATKAADAKAKAKAELEAAEMIMEQMEARAAATAEVSTITKKHMKCYSLVAAISLIAIVVFLTFGASIVAFTLSNRVIDNDKMMVSSQCLAAWQDKRHRLAGAMPEPQLHAAGFKIACERFTRHSRANISSDRDDRTLHTIPCRRHCQWILASCGNGDCQLW